MKKTMTMLVACLVLALAACRPREGHDAYAERMADVERQWQADIPLTSDTTMLRVVAFFDKYGTPKERAKAYYLLAATYYDLNDRPRAMAAALECVGILERTDGADLPTLAKACSLLSQMFRAQFNYTKALHYARQGFEAAGRGNFLDPIYIADVATACMRLGDTTSAQHYYDQALQIIRCEHAEQDYADVVGEMLAYSSAMNHRAEALVCLHILDSLPAEARPYNYDGSKARYYKAWGPMDSAIFYYERKLNRTSDCMARQEASRALMELCQQQGLEAEALRYARQYMEMSDSVEERLKREQTAEAEHQFRYRRDVEAEAHAYREANEARWQRTLAVGLALLSLLVLSLLFLAYRHSTTRRMRLQDSRIEHQQATNEMLVRVALSTALERSYPELQERFRKASMGMCTIGEEDWRQLYTALDVLHPGWGQRVMDAYPAIPTELLHIACLIKSGVRDADITRLMPQNRSTTYRKIAKVRERLAGLLE